MSLQWTLVASFLYAEIAFLIILLLPLLSPTKWQQIFRSRIFKFIGSSANLYFKVILVGLVLLLLDAFRQFSKLKSESGQNQNQINNILVKEFRAERNFYISGTALLLWFVIKRMMVFIQNSAQLIAENEAVKKQAESASRVANDLLKEDSRKNETEDKSKLEKELMAKKDIIKSLKKELEFVKLDSEAMKLKATHVSNEYDNLLSEHSLLTKKVKQLEYQDKSESKKDH